MISLEKFLLKGGCVLEFLNFTEIMINKEDKVHRGLVNSFLFENGLRLEENIDYTYALVDKDEIVATGSLEKNVIKCVAVAEKYQGIGITNKIISHLLSEAHNRGLNHLFVFTKPNNVEIFLDLGFYKITEIPNKVALLENKKNGIVDFINGFEKQEEQNSIISSVVVNCNPFTLGHRYLIEKAAEESDLLHVFVVSEDLSDFPADVRLKLVKDGLKHLNNVRVHQTANYLISSATFPSYFLKRDDDIIETHAELDLQIFATYFVAALGIKRRYVGEEPNCILTRKYNIAMRKILPNYCVEVIEVPRKEARQKAISASRVRQLLREDKLEEIIDLVPDTTYAFLMTNEGQQIINKIKNTKII